MTKKGTKVTPAHADALQRAIAAAGEFGHVQVCARRGHLYIEPDSDGPVARATPVAGEQFGLSFHTHTGRWEPMPVVGTLDEVGKATADMLRPYLAPAFSQRMGDPDH